MQTKNALCNEDRFKLRNYKHVVSYMNAHWDLWNQAQMVKSLSAMQEIWVRSLGREDSLEKEMATHSSTLA